MGASRPAYESEIQEALFQWLSLQPVCLGTPQDGVYYIPDKVDGAVVQYDPILTLADLSYAIPNGAWLAGSPSTRARQMMSLKKQGLKNGVFDVCCMVPTRWTDKPLYLELKRHKTSKPTKDQLTFQARAHAMGYDAEIAYSLEEAMTIFRKHYRIGSGTIFVGRG